MLKIAAFIVKYWFAQTYLEFCVLIFLFFFPLCSEYKFTLFRKTERRGAWVAHSVKRLTLAQVMISPFLGSSPASGSVLTAWSMEPASDSVSPSLSLPLPHLRSLCLSKMGKIYQLLFWKFSEIPSSCLCAFSVGDGLALSPLPCLNNERKF